MLVEPRSRGKAEKRRLMYIVVDVQSKAITNRNDRSWLVEEIITHIDQSNNVWKQVKHKNCDFIL